MKLRYWRRRFMGERTSLVFTSVLIGLASSLCAVALKSGVHLTTGLANRVLFTGDHAYLVLFLPCIGVLLSIWVTRRFLRGDLGRGLPNLLKDVQLHGGVVAVHKIWSQVVTSVFTIGTGGSAGLEAPLAITGAAIGSNGARWLGFGQAERTLLLASGAAAGVAAVFNAPIAGTVFALEILLVNNAMTLVVPVLIASASRMYHAIARYFARFARPYPKALFGSLALGALIFIFPPLFGEGYDSVRLLLANEAGALANYAPVQLDLGVWNIVLLALGLLLLKVVAASLTLGAGGNGGMFGPSLFIGAMLGFVFSHTVNLLGITHLNEVNFIVVGMAAMLSGTIHVPLTAIFLIAEITGGYALFVPLMVVSSLSYLVSKYLHHDSIYGKPQLPAPED
ncbi:MAG: chloride channel protein [Flavobacteriales bacterium]|nr:chloride channel protein [Flavobacteriales bacterium]